MAPSIELHIDELVLHGFPLQQRHAIAQAVEAELTRLFTGQNAPVAFQQTGRFPSLNAGSFTFDNNAKGDATGNKIAHAVYKSFCQ